MSSPNTTHLKNFHALQHPCSAEVINYSPQNKLIVCGCYEQIQDEHRIGSIEFIQAKSSEFNPEDYETEASLQAALRSRWNFSHRGQIKCDGGVLDTKVTDRYIMAALSTETLNLYELSTGDTDETPFTLGENLKLNGSEKKEGEGLFLSVDFYDNNSENSIEQLVVSTQSTNILVYALTPTGLQETDTISECHMMFGEAMPAWIVTQARRAKHLLMSGGDDCVMRLWDLRSYQSSGSALSTSKIHSAGVTCGQWHPRLEHVFASGSYDESICVWDWRNLRKPLTQVHTGTELSSYYYFVSFSNFSIYLFL